MRQYSMLFNLLVAFHFTAPAQALDMGQMVKSIENVTKMTGTVDGRIDFKAFKGKYVLIDLWATWCAFCVEDIPHLMAFQEKYKNDLAIVSISLDKSAKTVGEFFQQSLSDISKSEDNRPLKNVVNYNVVYFKDSKFVAEVEETFSVSGYPTYLMLNPQGQLFYFWDSSSGTDAFEEVMLKHKSGKLDQIENLKLMPQLWSLKKEERSFAQGHTEPSARIDFLNRKIALFPEGSLEAFSSIENAAFAIDHEMMTPVKAKTIEEKQKVALKVVEILSQLNLERPVVALSMCYFFASAENYPVKLFVKVCEDSQRNFDRFSEGQMGPVWKLEVSYNLYKALVQAQQVDRANKLKANLEKDLTQQLIKNPEDETLLEIKKRIFDAK